MKLPHIDIIWVAKGHIEGPLLYPTLRPFLKMAQGAQIFFSCLE